MPPPRITQHVDPPVHLSGSRSLRLGQFSRGPGTSRVAQVAPRGGLPGSVATEPPRRFSSGRGPTAACRLGGLLVAEERRSSRRAWPAACSVAAQASSSSARGGGHRDVAREAEGGMPVGQLLLAPGDQLGLTRTGGPSRGSRPGGAARCRPGRPCGPARPGGRPGAGSGCITTAIDRRTGPQQERAEEVGTDVDPGPLGDPVGGVPGRVGPHAAPLDVGGHRPRPARSHRPSRCAPPGPGLGRAVHQRPQVCPGPGRAPPSRRRRPTGAAGWPPRGHEDRRRRRPAAAAPGRRAEWPTGADLDHQVDLVVAGVRPGPRAGRHRRTGRRGRRQSRRVEVPAHGAAVIGQGAGQPLQPVHRRVLPGERGQHGAHRQPRRCSSSGPRRAKLCPRTASTAV